MNAQMIFKRYELKYILTKKQYSKLQEIMKEYMNIDSFGKHLINNIYYDTSDYLLIRRSIEKPIYKEKLRIRSYGERAENVFVEVKKKYDGIVYKRRLEMSRKEAFDFLAKKHVNYEKTQIFKEIEYFVSHYKNLQPMIELNYKREAFFGIQDNDFRMTFDTDIYMKERDTKIKYLIVPKDCVVLEVKTTYGIPTWLLKFFSENKIYKTSFSKCGKAYEQFILKENIGGDIHVA